MFSYVYETEALRGRQQWVLIVSFLKNKNPLFHIIPLSSQCTHTHTTKELERKYTTGKYLPARYSIDRWLIF